jgi:hypothetical protein
MLDFNGQQTDEVILYEIRPHWTRKAFAGFRALVIIFTGIFAAYFLRNFIGSDPRYTFTFGVIISLITGGVYFGWALFKANRAKAFITDRRFVRLEPAFPTFLVQRSLFWTEVLKVKSFSPNMLFRYLKIGGLIIQPIMSESGKEDVRVEHVFYYGDLANYIDKIMYTVKTKPAEIGDIRPFVPKKAGERY